MRQTALNARALAGLLNAEDRRDSAAGRSGVLCWRIARIATARLRAHPHRAYHRDASLVEALMGGLRALSLGCLSIFRQRPMEALQRELQGLSRVLDDARALTLLPELSDALGRAQGTMRQLLGEIAHKARMEGSSRKPALPAQAPAALTPVAQGTSPYLAL